MSVSDRNLFGRAFETAIAVTAQNAKTARTTHDRRAAIRAMSSGEYLLPGSTAYLCLMGIHNITPVRKPFLVRPGGKPAGNARC